MDPSPIKRIKASSIRLDGGERIPVHRLERALSNTQSWLENEVSPFARQAAQRASLRPGKLGKPG